MTKYFVAKEGIQKGPWTLDEITQNIEKKSLSWNDYIYDEKNNAWLFLFEFPALTESFNQSFKNPVQNNIKIDDFDTYKDRVWYILKTDENYGPFTAAEMIQMLQSKTLFEFDFIWRNDQASWQRLSDVAEFQTEKIKEIYKNSFSENYEIQKTFYRRKFPRMYYKCEVLIHNKHKVFVAESVEISTGGASFNAQNADFSIGSEIYLHFKPGAEVPAFNATCTVMSKNIDTYGVSFNAVSSAIKDSLEKFIKKAA